MDRQIILFWLLCCTLMALDGHLFDHGNYQSAHVQCTYIEFQLLTDGLIISHIKLQQSKQKLDPSLPFFGGIYPDHHIWLLTVSHKWIFPFNLLLVQWYNHRLYILQDGAGEPGYFSFKLVNKSIITWWFPIGWIHLAESRPSIHQPHTAVWGTNQRCASVHG